MNERVQTPEFSDREESPDDLEDRLEDARIRVHYGAGYGEEHDKVAEGPVMRVSAGQYWTSIEFEPDHVDNMWRVRLFMTGSELQVNTGPTDWRSHYHREPLVVEVVE